MSEQEQDLAEKVALSRKNYEIAVAIGDQIKRAGVKIDDLQVAVAGGKVFLSGITTQESEITKAAQIASKYPGTQGGSVGITLITEEQYQEWLRQKADEE